MLLYVPAHSQYQLAAKQKEDQYGGKMHLFVGDLCINIGGGKYRTNSC
jgi:hypothetical protein